MGTENGTKVGSTPILSGMDQRAIGAPRKAISHFRRALDLSQLPNKRQFTLNILGQTPATVSLQFFGGVGITPSSNINKTTHANAATGISIINGGIV